MKFKKVRGTTDVLDFSPFDLVKKRFAAFLENNQFTEIDTPILEHKEIFNKAVGQDSDVALKEMFVLEGKSEDGPEDKICLRPEFTTSFIRAYLESGSQEKNCRYFCSGPVFRHERPQKGRLRQFNQVNAEIINCKDEFYDLQTLELLYRIFQKNFKISAFTLEVNYLGSKETQSAYNQYLKEFCVDKTGLCQYCVVKSGKNALKIFDCKNAGCQTEIATAKPIFEFLDEQTQKKFSHILDTLALLGVSARRNNALVRGLDYYQGLVFEFKSTLLGSQSTFCAGGRYDIGFVFDRKDPLPCFGFGLGIERLLMILEACGYAFEGKNKPKLVIIPEPESLKCSTLALIASATLSDAGIAHEVLWGIKSFGKGFEAANAMEASFVAAIGNAELEGNFLTVKNMKSGEQRQITQGELISFLTAKI